MSYPPPPGFAASSTSSSSAHPSLPERPPPSKNFNSTQNAPLRYNNNTSSSNYGGGFVPQQGGPPPAYQQPQYPASYPSYEEPYGAAPHIRNPFAPPTGNPIAQEDPEIAAQIAQWQSAYAGKTGYFAGAQRPLGTGTSANAAPLGNISSSAISNAVHKDTGVASIISDAKNKTQTVVRSGGGSTWTDSSLLEWDPSHFRLFVGNLAGEVTDDTLCKAFSRWGSVQKARVIRDKRTTKSKGYGFVSFSDGDEFFQAAREMQGKYIGSHPVIVKRSTTEIKAVKEKEKDPWRKNGKHKGGKNNKDGKGGQQDKTGAGIKKGEKTKGGLKILG